MMDKIISQAISLLAACIIGIGLREKSRHNQAPCLSWQDKETSKKPYRGWEETLQEWPEFDPQNQYLKT